jgi:5'-nucleotidase
MRIVVSLFAVLVLSGLVASRVVSANQHSPIPIQILAINDFHGELSSSRRVDNRPVGGAAVLASYLLAAQTGQTNRTVIAHAGGLVGVSPPASGLLQDEPALQFFNLLANQRCSFARPLAAKCNLVGALGNPEFDEGVTELFRLLDGGTHPNGPFLADPYRGARFPSVSANVVTTQSGALLFPPYVIKKVGGVRIAFIGTTPRETPTIVIPSGVAGLSFLDEAEAINRYVPELQAQGIRTIIALVHQGGSQVAYQGPTQSQSGPVEGDITTLVSRLHDEIDVVISGSTHTFINALLKTQTGKEILVTQAYSAGIAYADIDLVLDPSTRDVVSKSAAIITTFADARPGLTPHRAVARLVADAEEAVAPLANRVIGTAQTDILARQNDAGESALGNLIADAHRRALDTDFAFTNPGGIRTDLLAGEVTWGDLFSVQPFGNNLARMTLTGEQIVRALNQQWLDQPFPRMLQISGLTYTWDNARPVGDRIVEVRKDGAPLTPTATYTVAMNGFLAEGGDNFTVFTHGTNRTGGPNDIDALITHIQHLSQPFTVIIEGRISRQP